jgi:hypothetical protein
MCNAWNHPAGCTCGWGGDGHSGSSSGGFGSYTIGCFSWQHRGENFCRPTTCPRCGSEGYFVRHNGGSVWFDKLGWPWPKHCCFDDDRFGIQLRRLFKELQRNGSGHVFGVIIETETTRPGEGGRIQIRCSDGSEIDQEFDTRANLSLLPGRLVVIVDDEEGGISLRFVNPAQLRTIAYLQLIENGSRKLAEEFAWVRKSEAEERLRALEKQHPGKHRLDVVKRTEY